jgi:hypothetical protein
MSFPATVEEFMESYKIVDREEVYTNGAELIPIFRMKQWFEHEALGKDTNVPTWIPVSERLPEVGSDVLITKEPLKIKGYEQEVIIAKRSVDPRSGKIEWWSAFGALKDKSVLAWMEKPKPWKGEEDGQN